jgi:hypothetical protein
VGALGAKPPQEGETQGKAAMSQVRSAIVWITGLFSFALVGALLGGAAGNGPSEEIYYEMVGVGFIAGPCLFICLRLWSSEKTKVRDTTFD